ncbi:ArsR/SmtB family transcription factor [Streptomyces sp. NPDC050085]|uniref:ArsR/SmtB family transcription factor n=1 Tax=Streptomyces sp. NPDC050085 TaxID=3365600 RepID=UPI0037B51ADA
MLQTTQGRSGFGMWRHRTATELRADSGLGDIRDLLLPLAPAAAYFPDFLTPAEGVLGYETGRDALLSTPRQRLHDEVAQLAAGGSLPTWSHDLSRGQAHIMGRLERILDRYYATAIAPYMAHIRGRFDAERSAHARDILDGGVERLLEHLHPTIQWTAPILQVHYHSDWDLHLEGRGLLLIPSFFCFQKPITLADPALTPVLLYPMEPTPFWQAAYGGGAEGNERRLAALVGPTRAALLHTVPREHTNSSIAHTVGISDGTATYHMKVLCEAGLVTHRRRANAVHYSLTPLGRALIGIPPPPHPTTEPETGT